MIQTTAIKMQKLFGLICIYCKISMTIFQFIRPPKNPIICQHPKIKVQGTQSNTAYSSSQKRNPYGRKQARKKIGRFIISPETVWNAGKFWYDESCKRGNRFSGFDIDRRIMPLSVTSNHVIDLPVNVVTDQETVKESKTTVRNQFLTYEKLHNMYLIGEGGIGKTTALYSIMKDAYREKLPSKSENEKQIIPLFIELSKAPAEYCSVYESSHSTFIRRYLFMLINPSILSTLFQKVLWK